MRIIKYLIVLCLLLFEFSRADISREEITKKMPAAWVFEISSDQKTLYLVGELHGFINIPENDIDFELGYKIFNLASTVYTEAKITSPNSIPPDEKLSKKLNSNTWKEIGEKIFSLSLIMKNSPEKAALMRKQFLDEIDNMSPAMAGLGLRNLSYSAYLLSLKDRPLLVSGLTSKLLKLSTQNGMSQKIESIEINTISDDVWRRYCNTDKLAQEYIDTALLLFDGNYYWGSGKPEKLQNSFKKNSISNEDFEDLWISKYPGGDIMLKCNIIPRNSIWLKKINRILKTPGAPVAVFVGIGHLLGKNGILADLRKNQSLKIERMY